MINRLKRGFIDMKFKYLLVRTLPVGFLILFTLCLTPSAVWAAALPALGNVDNMFPSGGSSNSINAGDPFDVFISAYKSGVTEVGGQGANITCTLHWGQVTAFGGTWSNTADTPMSFNSDQGNDDEYKVTITPPAGLYEFTANCTDASDNNITWQSSGSGQLTVVAPTLTPTATSTPACVSAITVTNANDSGAGSLRQAIAGICTGGTITFAGNYTINLASELSIDNDLTIDGAGYNVAVSGGNLTRVFYVSNVTATQEFDDRQRQGYWRRFRDLSLSRNPDSYQRYPLWQHHQ